MQIDRMFKLTYILLDRKQVTAKSLAEKLEVSTRIIYRDFDKLSLGLPIYRNKGRRGGIGLFRIKGDMVTAVCEAWNEIWKLELERRFDADFELPQ